MRSALLVALLVVPATAAAEAPRDRYAVQRGETLEHVAEAFGCTTAELLRANRLDTTLVMPGTVVTIPACRRPIRARARARTEKPARAVDLDARAREALAVIDGTTVVRETRDDGQHTLRDEPPARTRPEPRHPESVGEPWAGRLHGGQPMPAGEGYQLRRPARSYGAGHVVDQLRRAIAEVRVLFTDVHTLAIGDLSAQHGGKIADHHSHQSGLDVDVGFYFRKVPSGYPGTFVAANADLDLEANWALLVAFARTLGADNGVQVIFLDYEVQGRLYRWATGNGTPRADLEELLQYPRGKDSLVGLVRHWPNHADHFHVRWKPDR